MKRLYKNSTLFLAFLGIMLTFSCQKVEYRDRHEGNEISDVYATYENRGRDRLFEGRIVGDTIFIDIDFYHPIDSDNEVDLSKLLIRATVPSDAKISPSLADFWDLTSPRTLTVTSGTGDAKTYIVKANKQGNTDVSRAVLTYEDESGSLQEVDAIILGDKINFSLVPGTVMQNAKLTYLINRHATASIANGGSIDLSSPVSFVVTSAGNARRAYTLQVIEATKLAKGIRPGSAKVLFAKRMKSDLGINADNLTGGIAVSGKYVVLNTRNENSIYLDAITGQRVGEINLGSIRGNLRNFYSTSDDAGNILVSNLTPNDGNTFNIWKISSVTSSPESLISWDAAGAAYGRKISVIGDVDGDAIISAPMYGAASLNTIARWQVVGGNVVSQTPTILTVSEYAWSWNNADAIFTSATNPNSDYYLIGYGSTAGNKLAKMNGSTHTALATLAGLDANFISNAVDYIEFNNAKFVAYNHVNSFTWGSADQVYLIDTEGGFSGNPSLSPSTTPGLVWAAPKNTYGPAAAQGAANASATGDVIMSVSENGYYLYLYFMFTNGYVVGVQFDCVDVE